MKRKTTNNINIMSEEIEVIALTNNDNNSPTYNHKANKDKGEVKKACKRACNSRIFNIDYVYMNNTKLMNSIINNEKAINNPDGVTVNNILRGQKDASVSVKLYDRVAELVGVDVVLTPWDKIVMDAIFTLHVYGYEVFTDKMIGYVIVGDKSVAINKNRLKLIHDTVQKLRRIYVELDAEDDMYYRNIDEPIPNGPMIPCMDVKWVHPINNMQYNGYYMKITPTLYKYAKLIHQVLRVPVEYRKSPKGLSDTVENIIIKDYLMTRVELLRNPENQICSKRITYEWKTYGTGEEKGMFPAIGIKKENYSNWRNKKSKITQAIELIFSDWISKGYITRYSRYTVNVKSMSGRPMNDKMLGFYLIV